MALAVALAIAPGANGRAAERPQQPRRSFDFSPPRPGEMLANPSSGVGTPPRLDEFSPVAADDQGRTTTEGTARRAGPAAGASGVPNGMSAPQQAAAPDSAPAPAEDLSPSQMSLATRISSLGIDGFLASDGNSPTPTVPGEGPTFDRAQRELAASLLEWSRLYPRPPRMADAPVDADISPGRVIFRKAPDRMVGGSEPRF